MAKEYLLTGAFGFLGRYLLKNLRNVANVDTLGRSQENNIICDLGKDIPEITKEYDCVIHAAGKAHVVPKSEEEASLFYEINDEGTSRLLQGITNKKSNLKSVIFVSTVAVYGKEFGEDISEETICQPHTPYGKSKLNAETNLLKWGKEHNVNIVILRLPLVIGKKPLGNLNDMINAIRKGRFAHIGNGKAKRSMVLAEDVANFICSKQIEAGVYNLTDGENPSFKEIAFQIQKHYNAKSIKHIPILIARVIAYLGDMFEFFLRRKAPFSTYKFKKMTQSLTFLDAKARSVGWKSNAVIDNLTNEIC